MSKKTIGRRIAVIALCVVFVFCLACPAFAASDPPVISGSIYAGSLLLVESEFASENNKYVAFPFAPISLSPAKADICIVTYGSIVRQLNWWVYSGDSFDDSYCIGNPALLDPALNDNGEHFVFALSTVAPKSSYFACSAVFYKQYLEGVGEDGFYVHFNVPDDTLSASGFMDEATKVFTTGMSMVSDVAKTVSGNPILYLPIIIGLCGLGIVLFRRLKQ